MIVRTGEQGREEGFDALAVESGEGIGLEAVGEIELAAVEALGAEEEVSGEVFSTDVGEGVGEGDGKGEGFFFLVHASKVVVNLRGGCAADGEEPGPFGLVKGGDFFGVGVGVTEAGVLPEGLAGPAGGAGEVDGEGGLNGQRIGGLEGFQKGIGGGGRSRIVADAVQQFAGSLGSLSMLRPCFGGGEESCIKCHGGLHHGRILFPGAVEIVGSPCITSGDAVLDCGESCEVVPTAGPCELIGVVRGGGENENVGLADVDLQMDRVGSAGADRAAMDGDGLGSGCAFEDALNGDGGGGGSDEAVAEGDGKLRGDGIGRGFGDLADDDERAFGDLPIGAAEFQDAGAAWQRERGEGAGKSEDRKTTQHLGSVEVFPVYRLNRGGPNTFLMLPDYDERSRSFVDMRECL